MFGALAIIAGAVVLIALAYLVRITSREEGLAESNARLSEAERETMEAISEIADAQKQVPGGGSAADIAERLLARRRFGNPGRLEGGDKGKDRGGMS
jgi:glycerol dehydrogenase-like iron-containing ADH family enzyme